MQLKLKNKFFRKMSVFLLIALIALILSVIDFFLSFGIDKSISFAIEVVVVEFILVSIFLYTIYLLVCIVRIKTQNLHKKLIVSGLVGFIAGIISFFWVCLMYLVGNMSFWSLAHFFVMYLSLILIFIGIMAFIIDIAYLFLKKNRDAKQKSGK